MAMRVAKSTVFNCLVYTRIASQHFRYIPEMAVSGIPEMSVSGTIPEVRLKVDMILTFIGYA